MITDISGLTLKVHDNWVKGKLKTEIVAGDATFGKPRFTKELSMSIWAYDDLGYSIHIDLDNWVHLTGTSVTEYQNIELLRMSQVTLTELKGLRDTMNAFIDAVENNNFSKE